MKRIIFHHFTSVFNLSILIVCITAIIGLNFLKDIPPQQLYWYQVGAYMLLILYFLRIFIQNVFLKNFVGWTRNSLQIKIGTRKNTLLYFDKIQQFTFRNGELKITTDEEIFHYNLKKFSPKSIQKFLRILEGNTR